MSERHKHAVSLPAFHGDRYLQGEGPLPHFEGSDPTEKGPTGSLLIRVLEPWRFRRLRWCLCERDPAIDLGGDGCRRAG